MELLNNVPQGARPPTEGCDWFWRFWHELFRNDWPKGAGSKHFHYIQTLTWVYVNGSFLILYHMVSYHKRKAGIDFGANESNFWEIRYQKNSFSLCLYITWLKVNESLWQMYHKFPYHQRKAWTDFRDYYFNCF